MLPIGARTNIDAELARLKRDVARAMVYAGLADALILWGGILLLNDAILAFARPAAALTWLTALLGIACTYLISQYRARSAAHAENARRLFWCFVALLAFLVIWQAVGIPAPLLVAKAPGFGAQDNAAVLFQLTFVMFGLVLLGIWVGWFLIGLGAGVSAAVLIDYLAAPRWFVGSSILIAGTALLAAGIRMRLSARDTGAIPFTSP
jgi:uncharacterized membrane protein SirB2